MESYLSITSLGVLFSSLALIDIATPCSSLPQIKITSFPTARKYLEYISAGI